MQGLCHQIQSGPSSHSLSKSKASDVKLPRFGGKPDENFAKFKVEMLQGFKSNKVRKEDQVKKLRENLFDQPKTMVCTL